MEITTLTVSKKIKISINYNSFETFVSITANLDEGDDFNKAKEELSSKIDMVIEEEMQKIKKYIK